MKSETPRTDAALLLSKAGFSFQEHARNLEREINWLTQLVETIRDKADLRYAGERGLLAFAKLKDEAAKNQNRGRAC